MKQRLTGVFVCLVLILFVVAIPTALAAETKIDILDQDKQLTTSVVFKLGVNEYFVDNEVPGTKMDVAPFIENDRTYVPIRFLSNALGVTNENIAWESPRVTLTEPGFPVVELAVGNKVIKSDGVTRQMDVSPLNRSSRTFLPARFVAEALGYEVDWDAQNQIVTCWPKGTEKPDIQAVVDHLKKQEPVEPVEPVGATKIINGYTVPVDTGMKVYQPVASTGSELSICLDVDKPFEKQYADTRTILSSKFDSQTVDAVINHVKKKTDCYDNLPDKDLKANGKTLNVGSNPGNYFIQILIY